LLSASLKTGRKRKMQFRKFLLNCGTEGKSLMNIIALRHWQQQLRKIKTIGIEDSSQNTPFFFNDPSPYELLEREETSRILNNIIERLPDIYRDVLRKREIEGLSYEEIAEVTGQNINTLRVALSRARGMIRDELKRINYEYRGNSQVARKIL
jgi:RNA polymerase sigma factor (sigma-70 family)